MRCSPLVTGLVVLLASAAPVAEDLRFGVQKGARLEKSFEDEGALRLDERELTLDDQVLGEEEEDFELVVKWTYSMVFVDEYREVSAERPLVVAREFRSLGGREETEVRAAEAEETSGSDQTSELEGKTVVFTWDEDEERYDAKYEDEKEKDEELLQRLLGESDLVGFLPPADIAEGDSWKVSVADFRNLTDPGGELHFLGEDDERQEPGGYAQQLEDNEAGDVVATYEGTRDEGGVRVAVITLRAELASEAVETSEDEDGDPVEDKFVVGSDYEGELLWDLAQGRPHAYRLTGELEFTHDQTTTWEDEDGVERVLVMHIVMSGSNSIKGAWRTAE